MVVADLALARRLESFQGLVHAEAIAATQRLRPDVGAAVLSSGDGNAAFAGVGSPLTQAIGVALGAPISAAEFTAIEEFFFDRGADAILHVTPWSDASLYTELAARNYAIHEFENVFVKPIAAMPPQDGIDVREVATDTERMEWTRVCAEAFSTAELSTEFLVELMTPFTFAEHARGYVAYIDGETAGGATAFAIPDRGIVGLFGAGTRERFRNRGVQAALLQRRLADAAASGCELAFVTTLPGSASHRNVLRSGFELVYTKVNFRRALP